MLSTPQPAPFQSASLYVGDLHTDITEGFLFEMFNRVGPVASIRVCRDTVTRRSLGYAYVNFHNVQDAERALEIMNYTDIKGRPCRIMWSQRDPSLRKSGVGNIFVNSLAPSVDNKGLLDVFSAFGNILSCKVATDENGVSKGYGYVHYETAEAAQEAVLKVNGMLIDDIEVVVSPFLRRQDRASQNEWTNLYVKQFPDSWTDEKLGSVFSVFGTVTSAKVQIDVEGRSKRFGFVDFADHISAEKAVNELNGKIIESEGEAPSTLYVGRAQKKAERNRELRLRIDALKVDQINKSQGMNLYVKNIDDTLSDEQFRELFQPYGTITSARIMRDEVNGTPRGFAFVCYSSPEEATRAVSELNGKMIRNKPLFVALHQNKEFRRQQLAAAHSANRGMGALPRYPMSQAPMPYMNMYMNPGQQMPPRQPYPMIPNMMPRGPAGGRGMPPNFPGRGAGYPMPQYGLGGMPPGGQMQMGGPGMRRGGPMNMQGPGGAGRRPGGGRGGGGPMGRGMPPQQQQGRPGAPNMKYSNQVRNQPQGMPMMGGQMPMAPMQMGGPMGGPLPPQGPPHMQILASEPLDHNSLALADPHTQKNMIGERLYPLILQHQPDLAGKITGMLLEMDNAELLHLLESPEALLSKTAEALNVLEAHNQN